MIILVYNTNNKITKILNCTDIQEILPLLNRLQYKKYTTTSAYVGLDIRTVNEDGTIKTISQQVEMRLLELAEDEIIENNIIRKLTIQEKVAKGLITLKDNEEIRGDSIVTLSDDEMRGKFPNRYPEEDNIIDPIEEELLQIESEIYTIEQEVLQSVIQDRIAGRI